MEGRGGRNELQFLEDTCKLYSAYAWLSYRMPETFPHGELAQSLMQSTSEKIDALLQVQNTRHRQQRKPAHKPTHITPPQRSGQPKVGRKPRT
ncbi:hypothetical protein D3C78_1690120 [compost metagenome]